MFDPMKGQIHGQESNPDYWADDWSEPEVNWSEFEADYELTGLNTDDDNPNCDLRNWQ
jgi:hypothetical protein